MSFPTGAPIFAFDSWVTLESSGASVAAGAMSAAASTEATSSNHQDAILVEFGAELAFGANTPTQGKSVALHIKRNTVDGTAGHDAGVPAGTGGTITYPGDVVLSRQLKASSGTQYVHFGRIALPAKEFDSYLYNGDDTDAFTWKLYMMPVSQTES